MMLLAKYNTATDFYIPMVKRGVVDLAVSADWTPATGDVKLSKDGGADANIGTLPSAPASTAAVIACAWSADSAEFGDGSQSASSTSASASAP